MFTLVFAVFGWGVGIERLSDNSFFWHLRTGGLILDHGFPHADPYSYVAKGTPWVVQSWLAEVAYGGLDRLAGPFAIRVFGGLVGVAITVLVFRLALRLAHERMRAALVTVAALGALYTLWSERPLLLGVLFFVLLLWVVEVPDGLLGRRELVALPVVFWLWANVHGTFALGLAYLGLHLLGRWLEGHRPWEGRERRLVLGGLVAFLACFLNPYGVSLVTFPVDLMARGDALKGVIEWSSPDFHSVRGLAFALWVVVFVVVLARGHNRVTIRDVVVTLPFLVLGFWALRNIAIAPLVGLPVVARAVAVRRRSDDARLQLGWVFAVLLVGIAVAMGLRAAGQPDFAVDGYPVEAMNAVERQGLLGAHVLTDDADAGYVILRYGSDQRVFMDDRYDMYPLSVIHDFTTMNSGTPGWDRVLRKHDVEVVVWGRDRVLTQLLRRDDGWRVTYGDPDYVVLVRDGV
ncbi:MAG: hypothetical protein MUP97_13935 [Acidimicrobiia bacterium]|nr:hypothetical protein [Acidimicrobiia bacterium]